MTKTTVEVFNCDRCKKVIPDKVHHVSVRVEIMTSRDGCYIDTQFSWKHLCVECRNFAADYFAKAKP